MAKAQAAKKTGPRSRGARAAPAARSLRRGGASGRRREAGGRRRRRSARLRPPAKAPAARGGRRHRRRRSRAATRRAAPAPQAAPRVTAESLAQKQREISVSEFFVKNRHLLGFDNPSKALLTTIKEAVDNSLDACEEAGILPELHDRGPRPRPGGREAGRGADQGRGPLPRGRPGQRPRHRQGPGAEDLRQAALRLEVPPAEAGPRPAGHRHLRGGDVRAAHDRQADPRHEPRGQGARPPTSSTSSSTPARTSRS